MSIKFPTFIGREQEIKKITRQVEQTGHTLVVSISGTGGIGKTALLRKVYEQYKTAPDILVTPVIDFSHTVHRSEAWILEQIIGVASKEFPMHRKKMRKVQSASEPLTRLQYENELVDAFVEDYNQLARQYRIILLFDTLELIQDSPYFVFILELTKRLKNTILLLAGRRNGSEEFAAELDRVFKKNQIKTISLEGFDEKEAARYFEETQPPHLKSITPDLRKNIFFLSDGKPIKIALSLDWLDRGIPVMTEFMQMNPSELEKKPDEEKNQLRIQFESVLMEGIRKFQKPVDEVILYMAHFSKRFNRKMLEFFFLNDPEIDSVKKARESRKLVSQIKQLPFVKYTNDEYFMLHDEMARLVQTYVWDTVEDPDRTLRRQLSKQICLYYEQELETLPAWENSTEQQRVTRRSYEVEALYYKLYANFQDGFRDFEQLYETLVADRRSGLATLAINFVQEFATDPSFSPLMQCFINGYYSGGILVGRQKFEDATDKLVDGEHQLQELLVSYDWKNASLLDHYLQERIHLIYQQLGYCYRSLGDWEHAEENYRRSLDLGLKTAKKVLIFSDDPYQKKTLARQIAEVLNNLANLYRLRGEFFEARLLCQTSILLRKAWGLDTVMSLYVMSMIVWEMGDTASSVSNLTQAEMACNDQYKMALLKKYHAYILFRTGLVEQALPMLDEAEAVFRQKIMRSELADVLNIRCRIYRTDTGLVKDKVHRRSFMKYVEELGKEAYTLAKMSNDKFRIAECHLTQAFHYYQWSKYDPQNAADYRQHALDQWNQGVGLARGEYHQIYSLYCQLRGDLAFDAPQPDYELAFQQYVEQCKVGTHFKQATYERGIDHLGERLSSLSGEDPKCALDYIDKIIAIWNDDPDTINRTELVDELREVQTTIRESEKLKDLQDKYDQAMLAGKLDEADQYSDAILQMPGFYTDANRAGRLLAKSEVAHRKDSLAEARRYAKVALQLGHKLNADELIGNANLIMTSVMWDTTSTAEAAEHLKAAKDAFEKIDDQVGLARVQRFYNYILYRTGNFEGLLERLQEVAEFFDKHQMNAETADVKNIMSRVARTNPVHPNYEMAERFAEEALVHAEVSRDTYRQAECLLSLAILSQRKSEYENVLHYCDRGIELIPAEAHAIRTPYEGVRGAAYYEMADEATGEKKDEYWENAFDAFGRELIEACQSKPASIVRTSELLFNFLIQLPTEERVIKYTQRIEQSLIQSQDRYPQVKRSIPYITQVLAQVGQFYPLLQAETGRKDA